jgi:hypothetical protein
MIMTPRKNRPSIEHQPIPEPYPINPVCAANLATITANLLQVTKTNERMVEKIEGNGKIGLEDQTTANTRDITNLTVMIKDMIADRKEGQKAKEVDTQQRKSEIWKWWLGIAAAAVIAVISLLQSVATFAALNNLDKILPGLAK